MLDKTTPHIEKAARIIDPEAFGLPNTFHQPDEHGFVLSDRDEARAKAEAILSTTREPSEEEVEAATRAHTPVVFMDTTGWDETSAAYQATMKAAALTHMRAALIAAARVRVGE